MDAVEFLKEKERMCSKCTMCPADKQNNGFDMDCDDLEVKKPEELVAIVEKWSAEHPVKTRQNEFLKMFPNPNLMRDGVISICPRYTDVNHRKQAECYDTDCVDCMKEYWLAEVE